MDVRAGTARKTAIGPGTIELEGASLHVGFPAFMPGAIRGGAREISQVSVAPEARRQGKATRLIRELLEQMDHERLVAIVLVDRPGADAEDEGMTPAQLADWYAHAFGFVTIQTEPVRVMARYPGARSLDILQTQAFQQAAETVAQAAATEAR